MNSRVIKVLAFIFGSALVGVAIIGLVIGYFSLTLPKIRTLADYNPPIPSKILAKDGTVLAEQGTQKREIARFDEIPKLIVDAFLSAEDSSFFEHKGVDYLGVLRALIANLKAGKVVQGGSTITQQVAKSLLLTSERSISRKIKDFLLAQKIEKKFSKEDILFLYLNQVYLGGGYWGVKSAFKGYFRKELSEATVAEAAMIAGLLVRPSKYSPYIKPKYAKRRQGYVLKRMFDTGKISENEYKLAIQEKIKYYTREAGLYKAPYFTEWVRQRVVEKVGEENFKKNGFVVQTTLDWELQEAAEKAITKGVKDIDKRQGFKGPIKHLETDEAIEEFVLEQRKKIYKDRSTYFTLNDENEKEFEFSFDEEKYAELKEKYTLDNEKYLDSPFMWNTKDETGFLELLEFEKDYEAVVLKVHDSSRMVYVSIAGVHGMIPYENFRWAHERNIQSENTFYSYVTRPSTILKRGDVVHTQIIKRSESLNYRLHKDYRKRFLNNIKEDQDYVKKLKSERLPLVMLDQPSEVQAALFSIDPKTGEIVSFVGGADYKKNKYIRTIQSNRQPGSAFKPFLYAAGLENGFNPASIILDSPEALSGVDESLNWKPRNYDGKFNGPITYRYALEMSRNVPAIKVAAKLGLTKIKQFVERIGLKVNLGEDLTSALGSFGVNLKELVSAYAIFPNGGRIVTPRSIISVVDRFGTAYEVNENGENIEGEPIEGAEEGQIASEEVIPEVSEELVEPLTVTYDAPEAKDLNPFLEGLGGDQVYDRRLAFIMTNLLRGVVLNGTAKKAKTVSTYLGGKTGTTNSFVDAWFVGFSSNLVSGVWTGFDDNQTLGYSESGSKAALPMWIKYMKKVVAKYGENDFTPPEGLVNIIIDRETGKPTNGNDPNAFVETFVSGNGPDNKEQTLEDDLTTDETEPPKDGGGTIWYDDYYNE